MARERGQDPVQHIVGYLERGAQLPYGLLGGFEHGEQLDRQVAGPVEFNFRPVVNRVI